MPQHRLKAILLALTLTFVGCSDDGGSGTAGDTGDIGDAGADSRAPTCDATRRPVVFVHGFLASGDTFANHAGRFASNGYCLDWVRTFDWNTLDQGADHESDLDDLIDSLLAETGAAQVDLAGHSAGGGIGYGYLSDADRAQKVAHYAHVGSGIHDEPAGPDGSVPTLNLWSADDLVIGAKGDIPGATNVRLSGEDHYAVATSEASFQAIYSFFNDGEAPETLTIEPETPIELSGFALTLGENLPAAGGTVAVWEVDPTTGWRVEADAAATFTIDDDGGWGPFVAEEATYYELRVQGAESTDLPVHYYFEPFERSSQLVYLRLLPGPTTLAGVLLSVIPYDDDAAVLVNFTASTGIIAERDSLTVDGVEVATETHAAAEMTTIALFFFDGNENQVSDGTAISAFADFPFLNGVDAFFPTEPEASIEVVFNGSTLRARAWPSESEGATISVFR